MAFHVACPLTCRRICSCELGFAQPLRSSNARSEFLDQVDRVAAFLRDPWSLRPPPAVQVLVPRVEPSPTPPPPLPTPLPVATPLPAVEAAGDGEEAVSAQAKRASLQRRAAAASLAAEDYARKFEAGDLLDAASDAGRDTKPQELVSSSKAMCRLCYTGEIEGSEKAIKMLACKSCGKKYHRHCLKSWAQFRDLFHWSSWTCPSCRVCEECRRAGDPNKFMFCKRCDGAYHCYCQHPPHKNVSSGPYLCTKHTKCHSCGSTVSGSGLSTRWFLGYTCCDACGRLFMKEKYCPVCLKVYRDSESTPMVCCDVCEHWVHCDCDGISEEKYQQFQADGNLHYKCAACRGDCYKVRDGNDAVQELWRRRDLADRDLIASLRAAAGLPSQEDVFSVSPYSDDDDNGPMIYKNENGLKLSVKGFGEKVSKNKEHGKKSSKSPYSKKYAKKKAHKIARMDEVEEIRGFESIQEAESMVHSFVDENCQKQDRSEVGSVPLKKEKSYSSHIKIKNSKAGEGRPGTEDKQESVAQIKSSGNREHLGKSDNIKGTKLVIHLGSRNKNPTTSPVSEASTGPKEHDLLLNGNEEAGRHIVTGKNHEVNQGVSKTDLSQGVKLRRENLKVTNIKGSSLIRLGKNNAEVSKVTSKSGKGTSLPVGSDQMIRCETEAAVGNNDVGFENNGRADKTHTPKDTKPLLKLKLKNSNFENSTSWSSHGQEEKSSVKGQRSKRKRPSSLEDKTLAMEDENEPSQERNLMDEVMDANWRLKKMGRDAIGKRVEVHQASNDSWHKGLITNSGKDGTTITIDYDDGRTRTIQLGKQGIRLISHKQKRSKTVLL